MTRRRSATRDEPSAELVGLLESLSLATRADLLRAERFARRLARDLPRFDSVWVDALAQQRTITPFQAAEIHAGRAERLKIGPYVLRRIAVELSCGACYVARAVETGDEVWLLIADRPQRDMAQAVDSLKGIYTQLKEADLHALDPLRTVGACGAEDSESVWIACPALVGVTAAEWMVPEGRFPPEAVLEIACQMAAELTTLEAAGVVHGDLSAAGLVISREGKVSLPLPGVRGIVRPEEGFARTDRPVEAYDYLAPERITEGTPPDTRSDLFACGLVWWHLLCGRPPLAGGDALTKLKTLQSGRIENVRQLAPETPEALAEAIDDCLRPEPESRPASFSELSARLGPPTRAGAALLAKCLISEAPLRSRLWSAAATARRSSSAPVGWAALAGCLLIAAAATWPLWRSRAPVPLATIRGQQQTNNQETKRSPDEKQDVESDHDGNKPTRSTSSHPLAKSHAQQDRSGSKERQNDKRGDSAPGTGRSRASGGTRESSKTATTTARSRNDSKERNESKTPNELILSADEVVELDGRQLKTGQTVRAVAGQRARVVAPPGGLRVDVNDVLFENIDFVSSFFQPGTEQGGKRPSRLDIDAGEVRPLQSIIALSAARAAFRGCSFQREPTADSACVAIRWRRSVERSPDQLPETGRVQLVDCVLRQVDAAVECAVCGPLEFELENTLHLGPGPLVRVVGCPTFEESIWVQLRQCTMRESGPAMEVHYSNLPQKVGSVSVRATACVFSPQDDTSLLRVTGKTPPDRLLDAVIWRGGGSLLDQTGRFAVWRDGVGEDRGVDDATIPVEGIVRSRLEFVGPIGKGPSASSIRRWSAPLRGEGRPGISPSPLVLPELE